MIHGHILIKPNDANDGATLAFYWEQGSAGTDSEESMGQLVSAAMAGVSQFLSQKGQEKCVILNLDDFASKTAKDLLKQFK